MLLMLFNLKKMDINHSTTKKNIWKKEKKKNIINKGKSIYFIYVQCMYVYIFIFIYVHM